MPPSTVRAAGWTQAKDAHYFKVWARGLFGSNAFDAQGDRVSTESFVDLQLNVYGEYGVTDNWTALFFGVPTGYATVQTDTLYVGPLGLGLRRALLSDALRLALEARYAFEPGVGGEDLLVESSAGLSYVPAIRNHRGDLELQVGHGLAFGWIAGSAGMRFNSADGVDPAVLASAQLGFQFGAVQVDLHVQTQQPLGSVDRTNVAGVGQTRYLGVGLGVGYRFGEHVGAIVAIDSGAAQSNAAAPSLQAGAELR